MFSAPKVQTTALAVASFPGSRPHAMKTEEGEPGNEATLAAILYKFVTQTTAAH